MDDISTNVFFSIKDDPDHETTLMGMNPDEWIIDLKNAILAFCKMRGKLKDAGAGSSLVLWKVHMPLKDIINPYVFTPQDHQELVWNATISETWPSGSPGKFLSIIVGVRSDPDIYPPNPATSGISQDNDYDRPKKRPRTEIHKAEIPKAEDTLNRLGENETDRADQLVYKLYTAFWNEGTKALEKVSTGLEETIPDLILTDLTTLDQMDDTSGSGSEVLNPDTTVQKQVRPQGNRPPPEMTSIDLRSTLGWTKADDGLRMFQSHILVREEYVALVEYLDNTKRNVLLLGQPGIGKTLSLIYCLIVRLIKGESTIYSITETLRYLFSPTGVYHIPEKTFMRSKHPALVEQYKSQLVLFDLNMEQKNVIRFRGWRMLVSSSPQPVRYSQWVKQIHALHYVMRTWSWKEVYFAWKMIYQAAGSIHERRTFEQLQAAFIKYGGSARNLFQQTEDRLEREIQFAINNCPNMRDLFVERDGVQDSTSHALITINPKVNEHNATVRGICDSNFTSRYVFERLLEVRKVDLINFLKETFIILLRRPSGSRSVSGMIFEGVGHQYLFKSLSSPLQVRSLQDNGGLISLDLRHINCIHRFDTHDIGSFNKLFPNQYYRPLTSTVAGIDSFALEVSSDGISTSVVLFQFTVSNDNPINPSFLSQLWIPSTRASAVPMWKLVFVVPKDIAAAYSSQKWAHASTATLWTKRVSQYVLGVDTKLFWDPIRAASSAEVS